MVHDSGAKSGSPIVREVHHIVHWLALPPSGELVDMHGDGGTVHKFPTGLDSKPVQPGGDVAIPLVKLNYPLVDRCDLLQSVLVSWRWWTSVGEPSKLWWIEEGRNYQFILDGGVVAVLVVYRLPEVENAGGEGVHGPPS